MLAQSTTAGDVMLLICVIFFGNLLGNTFDVFPAWLKGQKSEGSSALFELLFYLATFWAMLPAKWLLQRRDKNAATTETGGKS